MRISEANQTALNSAYTYICNLCGYAALNQEKINVLTSFLRDQHGHNTAKDLMEAYNSLASGRLDEKMDTFKSLTGLSASRVLCAHMREKAKAKGTISDEAPAGKSWASDDTREIIRNFNGRTVLYYEEVTPEERDVLMKHWINRHYVAWDERANEPDRDAFLTTGTYQFLEEKGMIRIKDDQLQAWQDKAYVTIASMDDIRRVAVALQYREDTQMNAGKTFRELAQKKVGTLTVDQATMKVIVGKYFLWLGNEPF